MDIEEILEAICKELPSYIKKNIGFKKIYDLFQNSIDEEDEIIIELNEDIYEDIEELKYSPYTDLINDDKKLIFSFEISGEDMICFSLYNDDQFTLNFVKSIKIDDDKEMAKYINISIVFNETTTTWKITEYIVDGNDFYYDYNIEYHNFDKNSEEIKIENEEEAKDKEFSEFFGVSIIHARKYRLNFKQYIDYLNECKMKMEMDKLNNCSKINNLFVSPFLITELADYLTSPIYANEKEVDSETLNKALMLQNELINKLGEYGLFTLGYNIYINLLNYLKNPKSIIYTSGYIIRKINEEYTLIYIHLSNNEMIIFPKNISKEETLEFYKSNKNNKSVEGLEEFFNDTNKYGLNNNLI